MQDGATSTGSRQDGHETERSGTPCGNQDATETCDATSHNFCYRATANKDNAQIGEQASGKESGNVGAGEPSERTLEKSEIPIVGGPSQGAKSNL